MKTLADIVESEGDVLAKPDEMLPIDRFLIQMSKEPQAPKVIHRPLQQGSKAWTANPTIYVYAGIERAFVRAARLPGTNKAGYKAENEALLAELERKVLPENLRQRCMSIFSIGLLEERRDEAVEAIFALEDAML